MFANNSNRPEALSTGAGWSIVGCVLLRGVRGIVGLRGRRARTCAGATSAHRDLPGVRWGFSVQGDGFLDGDPIMQLSSTLQENPVVEPYSTV